MKKNPFLLLALLCCFQAIEASPTTLMPAQPFEYAIKIDQRGAASIVKQKAFNYMYELDGWCTTQKASLLIDIILNSKPQKIVEIGVFGGKSLIPMAHALKENGRGHIYGIDPWNSADSVQGIADEGSRKHWEDTDHSAILQKLKGAIERFNLKEQITLIRKSSEDAKPIDEIDILHVDGNHSSEASYLDVTKWGPLVKKGGWIILDDITWFENGAFTQSKSIEWLDLHCTRLAEINDAGNDWGIWVNL